MRNSDTNKQRDIIESKPLTFPSPNIRKEVLWTLAYYAVYLVYLFFFPEGEFLHWLSMVLIPFALLYVYQTRALGSRSIKLTLNSLGLEKTRLGNGLGWAILIGLLLSFLQLYFSRNSNQISQLFKSGKFVYLFPMALVLIFFTAGFTEEFFFRGVLQTRLQQLFSSKAVGIIFTSVLFGLYHLPYAYLNPHWPSHGNLPEAFSSALGQGIPMGLILGTVYVRTKNNLIACIIVHSLIDSLPAMLVIKF